MSTPIITCALTGGYHDKSTTPHLPEQPDEIVEQGIRAWEAGAAVLHVHARDVDGHNTMDRAIYQEIHERLCTETDAIIQLTTGGGLSMSLDERLTTALLNPEMCSLNMGFVLFFQRERSMMLANPRPHIERYAREMLERGVKPELEVYNVTMLEEVERLIEAGLVEPPVNISFVLHSPGQGAARGTWQNLTDMARRLPVDANCNVISMGRTQLPLTTMGLAMGFNVRVGLEDNIRYNKAELAHDNAQLVERTVRIARELELEPASADEARKILGTRGRQGRELPQALTDDPRPVVPAPLETAFAAGEFRP